MSRQLNIVSVKDDEVRKAEKERMAFDRDLRAVNSAKISTNIARDRARSNRDSGDRRPRGRDNRARGGRDGDFDGRDGDYDGKDRGDNRRSAGGKSRKSFSGPCYRCGQSGHKVESCSKPYVK